MKKVATTLLLWLTLIIGELHTLWENSTREVNWIYSEYFPMSMQWNVKMAGDELIYVCIALAFLFWDDNRVNRTAIRVFLIYTVLDLLMYFYNYKQRGGYEWVYLAIIISWIIIYNNGRRSSRTQDRQGAITKIGW